MKPITQLSLAVQLPDDETFSSYVSDKNQHVIEQLKQAINSDNNATGVYLFGQQGVGKSHLLHSCCTYASSLAKSSVCLSFSELQHLSVELLEGLEQIDVVCLDDIELICGNALWQQAVFDLFNRMTEQSRFLIITGSESVQQLDLSLPDLKSRLSWGIVEQIKPLCDEDKRKAFQFRAKQRGLLLQDETVKFLFNRLSRDMGHLLSCLDQLDKASIREQRKITIPFIKDVLALN
ncbi:MAG: DnaA regulatory inactivator Hda [Gammaproteobacteria bacterium]|nr:MAG: DnaA regulatory inactivator Hda [Gammaproteobacteria bacterium]